MTFPFRDEDKRAGSALIASHGIRNVVFSEGTYQIEIRDDPKDNLRKESLWPFLQVSDAGELQDGFCTCAKAEQDRSCPHLAAAYLFIRRKDPLHVLFRHSFWNILSFHTFTRYLTALQPEESAGQELPVRAKTDAGRTFVQERLLHRMPETEENSIKFSALSPDELDLWKQGTPTRRLQYELSFWSDLAKWFFMEQIFARPYAVDFEEKSERLPGEVVIECTDLACRISLQEIDWDALVPALRDIASPLQVHDVRDVRIKKMTYHPDLREISIDKESLVDVRVRKGVPIAAGRWQFVQGLGFFPAEMNRFIKKRTIRSDEIGTFLSENRSLADKYLSGVGVATDTLFLSRKPCFDASGNLQICSFAFEEGDLQKPQVGFFTPWLFLPGKGFFLVGNPDFTSLETVIPRQEVGRFVADHEELLNRYDGFATHTSGVQLRLAYRLDAKRGLHFTYESDWADAGSSAVDFGDRIYVPDRGFYKKVRPQGIVKLTSGMTVPLSEIPYFIHTHREELEQVSSFFNTSQPIVSAGLRISLDEKERICVHPEFTYAPGYVADTVRFFGEFTYVEGEGFIELPESARLPEKYLKSRVLKSSETNGFVMSELRGLKPFIRTIDDRLMLPASLWLVVTGLKEHTEKTGTGWEIALSYASDSGEEPIGTIKEAIDIHRGYVMTKAGLILLKNARFKWLARLPKSRIRTNGQTVFITVLEWIRLRIYEEEIAVRITGQSNRAVRERLEALDRGELEEKVNLSELQSTLRPYQNTGVKWLRFLYSYGLSGLLCDDMGLGKTHQAMALLASVHTVHPDLKFLVVCPTSVIYHWEDLLKRFLPSFKIAVFFGARRSVKLLSNPDLDVLVTSYGVLRSDWEAFSQVPFEIAVLDEMQIAKNVRSRTHQALTKIRANMKVGLTGTPIENRLTELKALFDVVLPGYLPSDSEYGEMFVVPIEKYRDATKRLLLNKLIHPFVLRRKKSEVLDDLPSKLEELAVCDLSDEQKMLYSQVYMQSRDKLTREITGGKQSSQMHLFALLNQLKRICNHPALFLDDPENYAKHQSGKWDLFVELVREARASGQKLVIFTQYLGMIRIISTYFKEIGVGFASIQGATQNRREQLEYFRDEPSCEVFIASLKAAGTGIDLTSASVVIHYDRWWNPAKENQATDRVHRIGQSRGVQVFKMVTRRSVEEHIHSLILQKKELLEGVVGYDDQEQVKRLSRDDLFVILQAIDEDLKQ